MNTDYQSLAPGIVDAEAREILGNTEDRAHLIENTAKAIEHTRVRMTNPDHWRDHGVDSPEFDHHWHHRITARSRITVRQQARAALAASELLKRVEELEQRIADARAELTFRTDRITAREASQVIRRTTRILDHPRPEPEPISIKP